MTAHHPVRPENGPSDAPRATSRHALRAARRRRVPIHATPCSRLLLALLPLLACSGCATIGSLTKPADTGQPYMGYIYSGVQRWDLPGASPSGLGAMAAVIAAPFVLVDFPLSLVADTLLLPATVPHWAISYSSVLREREGAEAGRDRVDRPLPRPAPTTPLPDTAW